MTRGEEERRVTGERREKVKSRNMYKGPMDKDNRWGIECGRGQGGESTGGEMGTNVIEQQ